MESPLLRAGVAAAQLALGQTPKTKKEDPDDRGSEEKKEPKKEVEVKKEGTAEACLHIEVFKFFVGPMSRYDWRKVS